MSRISLLIGLCLALLLSVPLSAAHAQGCAGFASRLQAGMIARVTPGEPNNVRAMPSTNSALVGQLPGASTFLVTEGPQCQDGLTWVGARNDTLGVAGYTVEGTPDAYWTEPASLDVLAENLAFDFPPVADDVLIELVPAQDYTDTFRGAAPAYLDVELVAPVVAEHIPPGLTILPVDGFADLNPDMHDILAYQVERLRSAGDAAPPTPFIFPWGAARLHESHAAWLESDLLTGARYLTQFGQYQAPITGGELFYTFQGLTRDGRYWVSMILPVSAPRLGQYYAQIESDIWEDNGISQEGAALLNEFAASLPGDGFYPALSVLDDVVRSLNFYGAAGLPEPVTTRLPTAYAFDLALIGEAAFLYTEPNENGDRLALYIHEDESSAPGWLHVYRAANSGTLYLDAAILDVYDFIDALPADLAAIPDPVNGTSTPVGPVTVIESQSVYGLGYFTTRIGQPVLARLTYRFQGFTRDGAYYLEGGYTITLDSLPARRDDMSEDDLARATSDDPAIYAAYLAEVADVIAQTPANGFSIPVETVSALFASFTLEE